MRSRHAPRDLLEVVDFYRLEAGREQNGGRREEMGQFPTPPAVARFMASMLELRGRSVRLLDAGAGVGTLTAAVVQETIEREGDPREIDAVAYELDGSLELRLRTTLETCRAGSDRTGVKFVGRSLKEDFVHAGVAGLRGQMFAPEPGGFDCAILNPPYRKIARGSAERKELAVVIRAADYVVLPSPPAPMDIVALIETVRQEVRPSGVRHRVLLTRVDARSRGEAEEARGALVEARIPVFDHLVREYKAHRTASLLGIPISGLGLRRGRNAEDDYRDVAGELLRDLGEGS